MEQSNAASVGCAAAAVVCCNVGKDCSSLPPKMQFFPTVASSPEPYWTWYRPFGLLFATFTCLILSGGVLLVSPLIIVGTIYRRYKASKVTYHTQPKDVKIAVIGGGWTGLQTAKRLQELGVKHIQGYERFDDIGGCWHPKIRYHGQQIHAPMYMTCFGNAPYSSDKDLQNAKLRGDEIQKYTADYVEKQELRKLFKFNAKVKSIHQDSKNQKARLDVEYDGTSDTTEIEGPFDLVIYTSSASDPMIPTFPGQDTFEGTIMHGQELKDDVLRDIIENKKNVVLLGGGKMAVDLLLPFLRLGYDHINWVYRNAFLFVKLEVFAAPTGYGLGKILMGISNLHAILASQVSCTLMRWILWGTGAAWTYDARRPMDPNKFKIGFVCPDQRRLVNQMDRNCMFRSSIAKLNPRGVELTDGRFLPADVLLLGTSCTSGMEHISFYKDGKPFDMANVNEGRGPTVLNYFTFQEFPVLGSSGNSATTVGPIRGYNLAELAVYDLCVQPRDLTLKQMQQISRWQVGLGRGRPASNSFTQSILYRGDVNFVKESMLGYIGMVLTGLVDFYDLASHGVHLFCLGEQPPFRMDILPRQKLHSSMLHQD